MHAAVDRRRLGALLGAAAIAAGGAVGSLAITALAGTKTGLILALAAIGGPVITYVAIVAPLVMPFGIYVAVIPLDNVLDVNSFGTLTKLLGIVAALAIVFYLLRTRRIVRPPRTLLLWVALYAWATCTAFWAIDQKSVFALLPTSIELVLLYAIVAIFPSNRGTVRGVLVATIGGAVLAAAYGAYLAHHGSDIFYGGRLRITSGDSDIDPNQFAASLLLAISLCIVMALYARTTIAALAGIAGVVVLLMGVAATESRGGILAICLMIGYLLVRSERRIRLALALVPGAIIAGVVALQTNIGTRFQEAAATGGAGRIAIWNIGLNALKDHWLIGAGYDNFAFAYDQAFIQTHQALSADWHRASHNLIVGTGVELGVIGLVLLLGAWIGQFRMLREVPQGDPDYPLRLALEATVLGTFAAAMFLDVMIFKYVWLTFMLAVIVRNARMKPVRTTEIVNA